jgi:hypothetical protein
MRAVVRLIDTLLSKKAGLFEFSQAPDVILRIQLRTAPHPVDVSGITITKGDPVLAIHIWNERIPRIPAAGADLEWALKIHRRIIYSFQGVARWMQQDPCAADIRAIFGISVLFSFSDHTGGMQMVRHLGFTVVPFHRPVGRFGEFWENLFSWWLMWTYNDVSLRSRKFWRLRRTEIWMTRDEFIHRFGGD